MQNKNRKQFTQGSHSEHHPAMAGGAEETIIKEYDRWLLEDFGIVFQDDAIRCNIPMGLQRSRRIY